MAKKLNRSRRPGSREKSAGAGQGPKPEGKAESPVQKAPAETSNRPLGMNPAHAAPYGKSLLEHQVDFNKAEKDAIDALAYSVRGTESGRWKVDYAPKETRVLIAQSTSVNLEFRKAHQNHADALYEFERASLCDYRKLSVAQENLAQAYTNLITARQRVLELNRCND